MCHAPWPPLECPTRTTRVFEGIVQGAQGRSLSPSNFSSAPTQYHTSAELGPCQSKPYRRLSDIDKVYVITQTQDVLPDGMIVQLRTCRGKASLQKGKLNISTPAPSDTKISAVRCKLIMKKSYGVLPLVPVGYCDVQVVVLPKKR